MKKLYLIVFLMTLFALVGNAQSATARKEIRRQSCADASIKAVKIGPTKSGFMATCENNGNSDDYVFQGTHLLGNVANGRILKTVHLGYYDISEFAHSCCDGFVIVNKWNGSSYVRYKCQEFDFNKNGNPINYRPCAF